MELDRHGLEKLSRDECLSLLGGRSVGRVGITIAALPVIFPVNFAILDGDVVFRSSPGSKLTAAAQRAVVAFEVDEVDGMYHSGWSVLIVGPAYEITDPAELKRAHALPLTPWAPGAKGHYIRIRSEIVSGRRVGTWTGAENGDKAETPTYLSTAQG
jgi:nitroimidazol reductase NimA-like FMN-containing flavoprotein (pyridoxamine 5'-phosphate oxidase superfamily)